ncbi:MAG: dephospho-CoA kinase [Treponemataceae bacterium]|nr:dephospho-CoA kinase [Treponemataceae bacterium]
MAGKIIAVTGPMASGKNLASELLEKAGCVSIDADKLVHQAVERAKEKILETFSKDAQNLGLQILDKEGKIDRRQLAKIIFLNEENLKKQEAIVHPMVVQMMEEFILANPEKNVILNATVLYKTPLIDKCNAIIYVYSPLIVRFFRAKKRDKLKTKLILQRFYAQKHLFAKYQKLNTDIYKVRNFGSVKSFESRLLKFLRKIDS